MTQRSLKSYKSFFDFILKEKEGALNYMEWMLYTLHVYPALFSMAPKYESDLKVYFGEADEKPFMAFKTPHMKIPKRFDKAAQIDYLNISKDEKDALRECFAVYEDGRIRHVNTWADYLFARKNIYEIDNEGKYTAFKYNAFNTGALIRGLVTRISEMKKCDIGLFWHRPKPVDEKPKTTYVTTTFIDVEDIDENVMNCYTNNIEFKYIDKKSEEFILAALSTIQTFRKNYNLDLELAKIEKNDIDNIVNTFTNVLYSSSLIPNKNVMKKRLGRKSSKEVMQLLDKNLLYKLHDICDDIEQVFYKIGKNKTISLKTFMMTNEMSIKEIDHPHYVFMDKLHNMHIDMKDDMMIAFVENVQKDRFKHVPNI